MPDTPAELAYMAASGKTILSAPVRAGIRAAVEGAQKPLDPNALAAAMRAWAASDGLNWPDDWTKEGQAIHLKMISAAIRSYLAAPAGAPTKEGR